MTVSSRIPPTVTGPQIAKLVGLTDVRVMQLARQGVMVRTGRGLYDLSASVRGYVAYLQKRSEGMKNEDGTDGGDLKKERTRLTKAKADSAEIEAGLLSGTVHDAADIRAVWSAMVGNARAKILALPVKCAGDLRDLVAKDAPPEVVEKLDLVSVREVLTDSVREALDEISDYDASELVENLVSRHGESVESPAEGDDEPVGRRKPKAVE